MSEVVFATPMTHGLVRHASPALIESVAGELDEAEWVGCADHDCVLLLAKLRQPSFIEIERSRVIYPVRMVNELLADRHNGVHYGVPTAAKLARTSDTARRLLPTRNVCQRRPRRQRASGRCDLSVVVAPATITTPAAPSLLAPYQPCRPTERRLVDELDFTQRLRHR